MKTWAIVLSVVVAIAVVAGASVGCFLWGKSGGYDIGWSEGYELGYDAGLAEAPVPEQVKLYLELTAVMIEGTASMYETGAETMGWPTAVAMERLVGEIGNDALSDAWWAYQYSGEDEDWASFLDTLAEQLRTYLE